MSIATVTNFPNSLCGEPEWVSGLVSRELPLTFLRFRKLLLSRELW